jgi:pyruvate/2-oxoglutarate dehydrogenase complex dihydrolipoamide dehydrogenase (E3) component
VIVIGAGAGGLTVAGGCAMWGLKSALIEEGEMGGDCLNSGCVPSKALIAAAHRAHEAQTGTRLGVSLSPPQVDFPAVMAHVHQAIETIAPIDSQEHMEELGVTVFRGRAMLINDRTVAIGDKQFRAKRIVIATGSRPKAPPIPGLDTVSYLTNETLFQLKALPKHLIIIGAGAIGLEMAQSFRRLGSQVTVLEAFKPMPRDDAEGAALVLASLEKDGVDLRSGVSITKVAQIEAELGISMERRQRLKRHNHAFGIAGGA